MVREVRCPVCHRKLCNIENGYVEIKCNKCKMLISYNSSTNIVRNKGNCEYSRSEEYSNLKKRETSSGYIIGKG